ncbi:LOW QUALITY PROTEIN: DE-cadherin-like [Macrobrachium nipponense]|uniref:LOW QUALITY PROTEIN: DE-cadherin-like n=1 Tax=Macrobrachium nipponense TaxID=159736 RepID=UPI0030C808D1
MVVFKEYQNAFICLAVFLRHCCTVAWCSEDYYDKDYKNITTFSSLASSTKNDVLKAVDVFSGSSERGSRLPGTSYPRILRRGQQEHHHHHHNHHHHHRLLRRFHRQLRRRNTIGLPRLEFSKSEYRAEVREDVSVRTPILQVSLASPLVFVASDIDFRVSDEDSFGIDTSGVLYNTRPLDYERSRGYYLLRISAEYKGDQNSLLGDRIVGETSARVSIVDVPEPPRFESYHYFFTVPELASTGLYVGTVEATDDDNDLEAYVLQDVRPKDAFTIDHETGVIRVGRILSSGHHHQGSYSFRVGAIDFAGQVTTVPVTVYLTATSPSYARLVLGPEEENSHKPIFLECAAYDGIRIKENVTEGTPVLVVLATDKDRGDNGIVSYFLLNDFGKFTIHSSNLHGQISTTKRLDRDGEDKEFYLTVVARDGGFERHQDSCSFKVIVDDINDNPPVFDRQEYEETISTDHIAGTPVLRVTASDRDSGSNAELSFSLQGDPDDMKYFAIDSDTGIVTLTIPLEKSMGNRRLFEMRARASDKGSPALWSTAEVRIQVVSSDDLPPTIVRQIPRFPEIWENTTENTDVLTLCARSNIADSSLVYFTLLNGNTPDTNSDGTFAVRRHEDSEMCHDAQAVTVSLASRNLFDGSVLENIDSMLITTIKAHDEIVSPQFRQLRYSFDAMASGDVRQKFALKSNGELWTTEPLDREEFKQYKIPIKVTDGLPAFDSLRLRRKSSLVFALGFSLDLELNKSLDGGDEHTVYVLEDRTVELLEERSVVVDVQNVHLELLLQTSVSIVLEFGEDGERGRGGDYTMLSWGRSTYRLIPLASLDREEQKVYPLPFVTQDQTGRRGIRLLTLEIGDENDSPMSDGRSKIKVYNYQGQFPSMVIGAVYVTDLDDFDLDDKIFEVDETTSSDVANYFQVDRKSGNITMFKGTPAGLHLLRVKVYDISRVEAAIGEVSINVVDLNFNSVMNSGSLTLADVRSQQMLRTNKAAGAETLYERLKEEIARIHEIPSKNVDVFNMQDVDGGVQIRYNCHGSPYYTAERLDGILMKNRMEVSKALGLDIVMVDINACLYESKSPCGGRSCQHSVRPNLTTPLVVASSTATMVGVDIVDEYTCDCGELEPLPSVCFSGFCYNGGTCGVLNNTLQCQCIDDHNYGPRCELKNARFEKSFAWYKPLKVCDNSTFSISFISNSHSGTLLYMGPIVELPWEDYPKDFMYVFLRNWVLVTYIELGSGTEKISIPVEKNNNRIFQLIVAWKEKEMTFEVVDCGFNSTDGSRDPCKTSVPYPNISMYPSFLLNVQGPLQVGGLAPMPSFASLSGSYRWNLIPPKVAPFSGCILEMRHNDFLYDLNATDYGSGPVQSCDAPQTSRVVLGRQSIIIILVSLLCFVVLLFLILCLARRGRKTVSSPNLDRELVKETMGGTDLEAFGEKDVTHFDLKFLQVTPDGYVVKDEEDSNLPDVTQDARQCLAVPSAKKPEGVSIGEFLKNNIKKVDQDHEDNLDDVRHYDLSGDEMSVAASLSSLASGFHSTSGSFKSEFAFDYKNDWSQRFEKIPHNIHGREADQGVEESGREFPNAAEEKKMAMAPLIGTATINRRKSYATNDTANCFTLPASLKKKNAREHPPSASLVTQPTKKSDNRLTSRNFHDSGVSVMDDPSKMVAKGSGKIQPPSLEGHNSTSVPTNSQKSVETWC